MAATALTINMPQSGGTNEFKYNFTGSCTEVTVSFSKSDTSVTWYNIVNHDTSSKKVTITASTNTTTSARTATINTIISGNACEEKCVEVKQKGRFNPSLEYLTFVAQESGTFSISRAQTGVTVEYSLDDGETWTTLGNGVSSPTVAAGSEIKWRGNIEPLWLRGSGTFTSTNKFELKGNPLSLLYGDDFVNHSDVSETENTFHGLFSGCTKLTSIEKMIFPFSKVSNNCCYGTFSGCTSLTVIPENLLPCTELKTDCYREMFAGCTSLTTIPENLLPATTLADGCYENMFDGAGITEIPENLLPAENLEDNCYNGMFMRCTSITRIPENLLPATEMKDHCYASMFWGCSSLTTVPYNLLHSEELAHSCYYNFFGRCTSLTDMSSFQLPAATLAVSAYCGMFSGCTSLTKAPALEASILPEHAYDNMFAKCSSLSEIKCLATDISAYGCTSLWVWDVASSGTFIKAASMNDWTTGSYGIPDGWTVQDYP